MFKSRYIIDYMRTMKRIAQKSGILLMLAASLAVAGHIYEHSAAKAADALYNCPVCQSIMAASAHAALPVKIELVLLCDAVTPVLPGYFSLHTSSDRSRAPPPVLFS